MSKQESKLTRQFCDKLRTFDARAYPIVGGVRQVAGLPDRYVVYAGIVGGVWVEFKQGDGKLSKVQRARLDEMVDRGANVCIYVFDEPAQGLAGWVWTRDKDDEWRHALRCPCVREFCSIIRHLFLVEDSDAE